MQNKLKLRALPKQTVQINKSVIILVAFVLVLLLSLAMVNAFNYSGNKKKSQDAIKVANDKTALSDVEVNDLPNSYSDIEGIKKYSISEQSEEITRLQRQVDELKNAYDSLEQQARSLSQPAPQEVPIPDPKAQQARTSNVVFSTVSTDVDNLIGGNRSDGIAGNVSSIEQGKFFRGKTETEQRLALLNAVERPGDTMGLHPPVSIISPYQLQRGSIIPATLVSGIDTTIPGPVIAQVRQNVYDSVSGMYLLIPKGSKLLGEYDIRNLRYGQNRVSISFTTLVRPDGSSIVLDNPIAHDLDGRAGLVSKVDNHWDSVLTSVILSTALSVAASAAGGSTSVINDTAWNKSFTGAAAGISGVGQSLANRALSIPPTISVDAGYQFNIILKKDIILTPYRAVI